MTARATEPGAVDARAADAEVLALLAEREGARLAGFRPIHTDTMADGWVTGYAARLDGADGVRERIVYLETAPARRDRPGVLRFAADDGLERAAWYYPDDPELPALGVAAHPDAVAVVLERLGIPNSEPVVELIAYRPGKRAVFRVTTSSGVHYLKVVRPKAVEALAARHARWRAAGLPVPGVPGFAPEGLVVTEAQPGSPADALLDRIDPEPLLDRIDGLRMRMARVPERAPARRSLAARRDWYHRRMLELVPARRPELDALLAGVGARLDRHPGTIATVHGDLHLGQLFLDHREPDAIVGLIDLDTAGTGDPADDLAALWAHLVATARRPGTEPAAAAPASVLAEAARARWGAAGDARAERIAAIAAVHVLGHAISGSIPPEDALALALRLSG